MNKDAADPRHVSSTQSASARVPAAEPPFAEQARTLVHLARADTLSTHSRKAAGFPFGSVAPYGVDGSGRPTVLISALAMHTQNLVADARQPALSLYRKESDGSAPGKQHRSVVRADTSSTRSGSAAASKA